MKRLLVTVNILKRMLSVKLSCLAIFAILIANSGADQEHRYVAVLNANEAEKVNMKPSVNLVYFHDSERGVSKSSVSHFIDEYESAAEVLLPYSVQLIIVECDNEKENLTYCGMENVGNYVFAFRDNRELFKFALDTMFSSSSIIGNTLQLVMLREVPIVQNLKERQQYEDAYRGSYDLIYSYQKAVGTEAHSVFMKAAFAFSSVYKFAMSTDLAVSDGLRDESDTTSSMGAVWILRCKEAPKSEGCKSYLYRGRMEIIELTRFLKCLQYPNVFRIPEDGPTSIYEKEGSLNVAYLYYNSDSRTLKDDVIEDLVDSFSGMVGITTIDVDKVNSQELMDSFGSYNEAPTFSIRRHDQTMQTFLKDEIYPSSVILFVGEQLVDVIPESTSDSEQEPEYLEKDYLMVEDDGVQKAVGALLNEKLNTHQVLDLTDKTFLPTVADKSSLFMVVFYLYFDARSAAFMRSYVQAAKILENDSSVKLARVSCFDWTYLCTKENITSYPTIRIYKNGDNMGDYNGMLDTTSVVDTMKIYKSDSPSLLVSIDQATDFIQQKSKELTGQRTHAHVLGLFPSKADAKVFQDMAQMLVGKHVFALAADDIVKQIQEWYDTTVPCIIVLKLYDVYFPYEVLHDVSGLSVGSMSQLVSRTAQPVLPEITMFNLAELRGRSHKFVIAFGDSNKETTHLKENLAQISYKRRHSKIVFGTMDIQNSNDESESIGAKILLSYDKSPSLPSLIYIDYESGNIYSCKEYELHLAEVIEPWLEKIESGSQQPTNTLPASVWEPTSPAYNFLDAILDYVKVKEKKGGPSKEDRRPAKLKPYHPEVGTDEQEPQAEPEDFISAPPREEKEEDEISHLRVHKKPAESADPLQNRHTEL